MQPLKVKIFMKVVLSLKFMLFFNGTIVTKKLRNIIYMFLKKCKNKASRFVFLCKVIVVKKVVVYQLLNNISRAERIRTSGAVHDFLCTFLRLLVHKCPTKKCVPQTFQKSCNISFTLIEPLLNTNHVIYYLSEKH